MKRYALFLLSVSLFAGFYIYANEVNDADKKQEASAPIYSVPDWNSFRDHQNTILAELPKPETPSLDAESGNPINALLSEWYAKRNITPDECSEDAVFIRRAYLDAIGLLPSVDDLRGFLNDLSPDKRDRLVDSLLLNRQAYAEHWMTFWSDLLRNDEQTNIDGLRQPLTQWLYDSLLSNKPYDVMVMEMLNPAPDGPNGFLNGVQWRGRINASQRPVIQAAQSISQVFLSTPMKCASCHNHFTKQWTLADTYGLAASFSEEGELEMYRCDKPTGEVAKASFPFKELGEIDPNADVYERRNQAAEMVVSPKNPRFARAVVNRLWQRLMGRGLFEPVDDLDNPAIYPELLDWLAYDFMEHGFDLKHTLRLIMTSEAYQSQALTAKSSVVTTPTYAAPSVRRMQSEQFLDAILQVTGYVPKPKLVRASVDNHFIRAWRHRVPSTLATSLGRPNREQTTTVREQEATVLQMLEMVNGEYFTQLLRDASKHMLKGQKDDPVQVESLVNTLFQRAYSREPASEELAMFAGMLKPEEKKKAIDPEVLEDALWILFMNPEFSYIQ